MPNLDDTTADVNEVLTETELGELPLKRLAQKVSERLGRDAVIKILAECKVTGPFRKLELDVELHARARLIEAILEDQTRETRGEPRVEQVLPRAKPTRAKAARRRVKAPVEEPAVEPVAEAEPEPQVVSDAEPEPVSPPEPAPSVVWLQPTVAPTPVNPRDAVTVLTIQGQPRANKLIYRDAAGQIDKDGGVRGGVYEGRQVAAREEHALAAVLAGVADDPRQVVMPGLFIDAGEEPFMVWPRKMIARQILGIDPDTIADEKLTEMVTGWFTYRDRRVIARIRNNTMLSTWNYFDRDIVTDREGKLAMPQALADLTQEQFLAAIAELWPSFADAAKVITPSTSARVLVNGKPWSTKAAYHVYFAVDDPDDLRNRVWAQLVVAGFAVEAPGTSTPISFLRLKQSKKVPGLITGRVPWAIWDPCTCWSERLAYEGAPYSKLPEVTVMPPAAPLVIPGGRASAAAFPDLPPAQKKAAAKAGVHLASERRERTRSGSVERVSVQFVVSATLDLDDEYEKADGTRATIRQHWLTGAGKVSSQAMFRESTSLAGYVNVHTDGVPFHFDTGADCKYVLTKAARIGPRPEEFVAALNTMISAVGGVLSTPLQLEVASRMIKSIAAAAYRHGWSDAAFGALLEQLAGDLAAPYGRTKSRLLPDLKRDAKAGPQGRRGGGTGDGGRDCGRGQRGRQRRPGDHQRLVRRALPARTPARQRHRPFSGRGYMDRQGPGRA